MNHPWVSLLAGPPPLDTLIIKHSSDQVVRTEQEKCEDKAKDTSNDSSLTGRLMTQHTKLLGHCNLQATSHAVNSTELMKVNAESPHRDNHVTEANVLSASLSDCDGHRASD
ncbi:hypothetical protein PAMP_018374 [Pampus punctatissimus]